MLLLSVDVMLLHCASCLLAVHTQPLHPCCHMWRAEPAKILNKQMTQKIITCTQIAYKINKLDTQAAS